MKILQSFYELLGPNICLHYPVTEETIEKHSTILFEVKFIIEIYIGIDCLFLET